MRYQSVLYISTTPPRKNLADVNAALVAIGKTLYNSEYETPVSDRNIIDTRDILKRKELI